MFQHEAIYTDGDGRRYRRSGYCCHCGACCQGDPFGNGSPYCPLLSWVVEGKESRCAGHGVHPYYLNGCNVWPTKPEHLSDKPLCTYVFTEVLDGD